jgi:hypothetical protein
MVKTQAQDTQAFKSEFNPSNPARIVYLDVLRGLMLVIMTFDHLEGPIKSITFQPLGFVSAAAGFIYLSGYVYGLVYTRKYIETDFKTIIGKSFRRATVIYAYHFLILIVVLIPYLLGLYASVSLVQFREQPLQSLILFLLLLFQPANMDILPMYIIFILAAPFVLKSIDSGKWKLVFILSGLLWLINQVPFVQYTRYDNESNLLNLGYFNIFCWQLIFFSGLFFGNAKATRRPLLPVKKWVILLAGHGLMFFIMVKYSPENSIVYRAVAYFSDRSTLGILRIINFACIAYLIYAITIKSSFQFSSKWLAGLGCHSLQVFSYSVCLVYFVLPSKIQDNDLNVLSEVFLDIVLVASLIIPATLHKLVADHIYPLKKL